MSNRFLQTKFGSLLTLILIPSIRIVRFLNSMKKGSVIFFLLLIAVKGKNEDRPLETQNDSNEHQINVILEFFQRFNRRTFQNSIGKWISQQKTLETPSEIINSKRIYFSKAVPDVKMATLNVTRILCNLDDELKIGFESNSLKTIVEGDIEFLNSGNTISCRAHFIFNDGLNLDSIEIRIANNVTHDYNCDYKLVYDLNKIHVKYDKVCKDISENQTQSTREDVLRAIENGLEKRCKLMQIPEYQSMFKKCMLPQDTNYIFNIEPDSNMAAFPWTHDPEIRWYVKSTVKKRYYFVVYDLLVTIEGGKGYFMNDLNLDVSFSQAYEKKSGDTNILDEPIQGRLKTLLMNGIKEIYADTLRITRKFIDTINEILRPFDKHTFKTSFVDLEIVAEENSLSDTISFIKIEIEDFHLENTTCVPENESFTTLRYKKLNGRLRFLHPVKKKYVNIVRIFADVYINEVIFRISQQRYSEYTNETEIQIDDNFNSTDIAIQITSEFYRLSQEERVSIRRKVFNHFVNAIKNKLLHSAKSTFLPMLNVCKNFWNSSFKPYSNPSSDPYRYFAIIRDYWVNSMDPFSTRQIDVIINGSWNFKFINVQYVNENVIFDDLRIENVVGRINIKENGDRNEITTLNYKMIYFSLIINHTDKNIQVRVPPFPMYSIVSAKSNIPLSAQQATVLIEKFQYTVASYIEQSIYSNSEYQAKFRKDIKQIIEKSVEIKSIELDASFKFTTWIAKSLKKSIDNYDSIRTPDTDNGILFIGENKMDMMIDQTPPIFYEMIYDHSDHSESENMYFKEQSNTRGTIQITDRKIQFKISFEIRRICATSTLDKKYDDELKLLVDRENIQVIQDELSNVTLDDVLKDTLVQHTSAYIKNHWGHFSSHISCESSFAALKLSGRHLYSIKDTITYSSNDVFILYHITLHGLYNLKSFRYNIRPCLHEFEITAANITVHVMWIQNIGGLPSRIPKEMILKVDKIILAGKIINRRFTFTNRSQLQFSDHENVETIEKLAGTIAPIVLESIQSLIYQAYTKLDTDIKKRVELFLGWH